jgi:tRNA-intron endonuclease, archaea type
MKIQGKIINGRIVVEKAKDVGRLFNKSHLGKPLSGNKLELDLIESCFLLDEEKIDIKKGKKTIGFEELADISSKKIKDFDIKYLAFKDLRKRGCIVRQSDCDEVITFFDYNLKFAVCVFSEKKYFDFKEALKLIKNIEKRNISLYFAVVDCEGDVTYYDVSKFDFKSFNKKEEYHKGKGLLFDNGIVIYDDELKKALFEREFFGKAFGTALRVSFTEGVYLFDEGIIDFIDKDESKISRASLLKKIKEVMPDFKKVYDVYCDLKKKSLIVKTGFKFGADFRVYTANPEVIHAEYLVQVLEKESRIVWSEMSRIIRLAHSVNKEIIFACMIDKKVKYIRFGRLRP